MKITPLKIPDRHYGEPIPVAPDVNDIVDKVDELVAAVNAGLATSNAIVGGDKYVRYLSSQTYGVPADALTLDRLDPATIIPGTEATVINPDPRPLTNTSPSTYYRATIVPTGTAGAVLVPAYVGSPDTVPVAWAEVVSNDTFTPLLDTEVNPGKGAYVGLGMRPLLIALVNAAGTGSSTVVTTPAPSQVATGPTITGFLPDSAAVGASVTLAGTGFTKATLVAFNGTPASFQIVNATTITAVVPVGATTGPVAVTNSAGTGTSTASFTVKGGATTQPAPTTYTATQQSYTTTEADYQAACGKAYEGAFVGVMRSNSSETSTNSQAEANAKALAAATQAAKNAITCQVQPVAYDNTAAAGQTVKGVTLGAQSGDTLEFNNASGADNSAVTMELWLSGEQLAAVPYENYYTGKPFRFTHNALKYTKNFAAGRIDL